MGNELNLDEAYTALADAACAVIERWDSPAWKDLPHTGESINALRQALAGVEAASVALQGHAQQQEAEEIHEDAKRLEWVMNKATLQDLSMYPRHVLSRGGDGDMSDIRTFIDAAMAQEAKSGD